MNPVDALWDVVAAVGRAVADGMTLAAEILCPRDHTAEDRLRSWESATVAVEDEICDEADTCEDADPSPECLCWVGHGNCGGCSGVLGITHEPACGWEWNPYCPQHADDSSAAVSAAADPSPADEPGLKLKVCTWCNGPYFKCMGRHNGIRPELVWAEFKETLTQIVGVNLEGIDDAVAATLQDLVNKLGVGNRFAVVALPEPCAKDDDGQVFFGDWDIRADCSGSHAYRMITTDFGLGSEVKQSMPPARAEWWARHLLAAAAEVSK